MQKVILSLVITLLFIIISYFEKKLKNEVLNNREIIISGIITLCSSLIVLYGVSYFGGRQNVSSIQQIYTGSPNF